MSELHETSNQKCEEQEEQIDTVGWGFAAVAVIITTIAAIIAYNSTVNTIVANTPVSHVAGPHG